MKLALLSCTKLKQDYPCKAKEMYLKSTLFVKASNYVENCNYDNWLILSAKYGLISKDKLIEPYDQTLNKMGVKDRTKWASSVAEDLKKLPIEIVDIYAGKNYREFLIPLLEQKGITCRVPLKGLGIGQQLKFYSDNI